MNFLGNLHVEVTNKEYYNIFFQDFLAVQG